MANILATPFMTLPNPVPGVDPGIDYALNLQSCMLILDQHNHSAGSGQQIQPNGLNISSDLSFQNNNATSLRTNRFSSQTVAIPNSGLDVGCLYVVNNELYYNDVSGGHQVPITSNGSVNAGAGSITGLPSGTASATYAAGTFVWQSATSTAAAMDAGSYTFRNSGASANGLTLQAPVLASNITETLPQIPVSTSFMQMDASGNMSASVTVSQGITASNIANNTITEAKMAPLSIGTAELIAASVTRAKLEALGQQVSSGCGSYNVPNSYSNVTNLTVVITTTGRPVHIGLEPDSTSNARLTTTSGDLLLRLMRDGTPIKGWELSAVNGAFVSSPGSSINCTDVGASAASHTYTVQAQYNTTSSGNAAVENCVLVVYEL